MPNALLDLSFEQVTAVIVGYGERLIDEESHAVLSGYYSGYYMGSKHPKSPGKVIQKLIKSKDKLDKKRNIKLIPKEDPDIERFKELDSKFARSKLGGLVSAK